MRRFLMMMAMAAMTTAGAVEAGNGKVLPFLELAKLRYSVRKYSGKVVPKETLVKILEAGNVAPTAMNLQPQRIHVLQNPQKLAIIDKLTHCRYGAPVVLVFTYNKDEDWKNPKEEGVRSGVEDVSIVATHIMLQAAELGVSTTWCNFFANTELEKSLGLPSNERSVLIMPIGYPAAGVKPSPMHSKKKPLEATVSWE